MLKWRTVDFRCSLPEIDSFSAAADGLRRRLGPRLRERLGCPPAGPCPRCPGADDCLFERCFGKEPRVRPFRICLLGVQEGWADGQVVLIGSSGARDEPVLLEAFFDALEDRGGELVAPPIRGELESIGPSLLGSFDVTVRLLSTTVLKGAGAEVADPAGVTFALFADRLLGRLDALARADGAAGLGVDIERLRTRAREVPTIWSRLESRLGKRSSRRQPDLVPVHGLEGSVAYGDVPGEFLPFLAAGTVLGVGNKCPYGYGAYSLEAIATAP